MRPASHRIRRQSLEIEVESEALALQLQARMGDFNRRHLLPVIERVCDELALPGIHQRLERIEVDLGRLPPAEFERLAGERLYHALKEALQRALAGQPEGNGGRLEYGEAEGRLQLLSHYLLRGYLPYWAEPDFRFGALFTAVAEQDPAGLVALVVHLGRRESVLKRLVMQLDEPRLRLLIERLEPEHGALVLAYLLDLEQVHRMERLVALSDHRFSRLVRQLALAYLVEEGGSQFNRRSFVRTLLHRIARGQGLDYGRLLVTLVMALERSRHRYPPRSSLPAVIQYLARELEEGGEDGLFPAVAAGEGQDFGEGGPGRPGDATGFIGRGGSGSAGAVASGPSPVATVGGSDSRGGDGGRPLADGPEWQGGAAEHAVQVAPGLAGTVVDGASPAVPAGDRLDRAGGGGREWPLAGSPGRQEGAAGHAGQAAPGLSGTSLDGATPGASAGGGPVRPGEAADHIGRGGSGSAMAGAGSPPPAEMARDGQDSKRGGREQASAGSPGRQGGAIEHVSQSTHGSAGTALGGPTPAVPAGGGPDRAGGGESVIGPDQSGDSADTIGRPDPAGDMAEPAGHDVSAPLPPDGAELQRELALRAPGQAEVLSAFLEACGDIAIAYRPAPERAVRVVLEEVRRLNPGQRLGREQFTRILWRLFGRPLPDPVERPLRWAVDAWTLAGRLPERPLGDFSAALTALEPRSAAVPAPPPAAEPPPAERQAADRRAALLERLLARPAPTTGKEEKEGGGRPLPRTPLSDDELLLGLRELLADRSDGALILLREQARDPSRRRRWARDLPEAVLRELLPALSPALGRTLLTLHELLLSAWRELAPGDRMQGPEGAWGWEFLLDLLIEGRGGGKGGRSPAGLAAAFFARAAEGCRGGPAAGGGELGRRLLDRTLRLGRQRGYGALTATLRQRQAELLAAWAEAAGRTCPEAAREEGAPAAEAGAVRAPARAAKGAAESSGREAAGRTPSSGGERPARPARDRRPAFAEAGSPEEGEPIYLDNAGLVLAGPFLPRLFPMLGWPERGMAEEELAGHTAHLLQFLVDGRLDAPEPELILNKLLCGLPPEAPVAPSIEPGEGELELCERLLKSLLANWPALANTSVAGLRETFLQRPGRLLRSDEGWRLTVQRKTLDVLVDQVPWSISVLYHPWMKEAIYVAW